MRTGGGGFGAAVRAHRRRLGLSQEDLAHRAGLGIRSIGKLEAGRILTPRPATVRLLADAFGLTGDERDRFCASAVVLPAEGADEAVPGVPAPARAAPAQLPTDVTGFTGRYDALRRLTDLLDAGPGTVIVSAIAGTAGVGKTSLAVHWAHRVRHRFPDGQLYVNLRGFDPGGSTTPPAEALRRFLDALGVTRPQLPAGAEAQAALYRSLLADRRMLVLLDNARDPDQVRPLLPGAPGCLVLVTSRNALTGLIAAEGARPLLLDLPSVAEARDLLAERLGADRVAAEPDAVDLIVDRCARLPLALAVVAARAAIRPDLPLAAVAAELGDRRDRFDALTTGDPSTDARSVFSWSYRALSADAARLLRLLGLHPGPDISVAAAASLAGQPVPVVRRLLDDLSRAHLVTEHRPGRYASHDLLRAYAAGLAHEVDSDEDRRAATHRVLDHYVHSGFHADLLLDPNRDPITLEPPRTGAQPETFDSYAAALDWFIAEHEVLVGAVAHAAASRFDRHTWQLAWTLADFLDRRGHWHDYVATQEAALDATRRLGDRREEARVHRLLAGANDQLGHARAAHDHLDRALELYRALGDLVGQAHAHRSQTLVHENEGRLREALEHAGRALELYRAAGHTRGQASALNGVGWTHAQLGEYEPAMDFCRRSLALYESLEDRHGQSDAWDSLGYAHRMRGEHDEAVACYRRALALARDLGNRFTQAKTLANLGSVLALVGDRDDARAALREALALFEALNHPGAAAVRENLAAL